MTHDVLHEAALTPHERLRLRPLLVRALESPDAEAPELRHEVRAVAERLRDDGASVRVAVRSFEAALREVASDETPYFDYDQVRERVALWCHTVYRFPAS